MGISRTVAPTSSSGATLDLCRWQQLCQHLGIGNPSAIAQEFDRIVIAYGEAHRAYHTVQHINECLELLDWGSIQQSPALEIALWYHDVVYKPQSFDNERQSAYQAVAFFQTHGVNQDLIHQVESLIMATAHFTDTGLGGGELVDWMLDIDLAILGARPQRFLEYNHQIRQEYPEVTATVYNVKRQTLLTQFLQRPAIYRSALFQERFEAQAQENLSTLIRQEIR